MRTSLAIAAALAGAIFCIFSALGMTEALCGTVGCALFKTASVAGINLYWLGAIGFGGLAALLLVGRSDPSVRRAFDYCMALGLVIDAVLLGILAVAAPCLNCMVVAALFGVTAWLAWEKGSQWRKVLLVWLLCFAAATSSLGRELVSPQLLLRVPSPEGPAMSLYFSPTCPGCKKAMRAIVGNPELLSRTALFAIAKNDEDTARLQRCIDAIRQGTPAATALQELVGEANATGAALSFTQRMTLWSMSMRNKLAVLRAGSQTVPLLQTTSPAALLLPLTQPAPNTSETPSGASLPSKVNPYAGGALFQDNDKTCGLGDAEPCE